MSIKCAICDEVAVTESLEKDQVVYGSGDDKSILEVEVIVLSCSSCGEAYTDYRGEEARAVAIADHLSNMRALTSL